MPREKYMEYSWINWYCDKCGDHLNKQRGFVDYMGTWRCRKCGAINGTTWQDIIDIDDEKDDGEDDEDD